MQVNQTVIEVGFGGAFIQALGWEFFSEREPRQPRLFFAKERSEDGLQVWMLGWHLVFNRA